MVNVSLSLYYWNTILIFCLYLIATICDYSIRIMDFSNPKILPFVVFLLNMNKVQEYIIFRNTGYSNKINYKLMLPILKHKHYREAWFSHYPKETLNFPRVFLGHSQFQARHLQSLANTFYIYQLPAPAQNYFINCEILP